MRMLEDHAGVPSYMALKTSQGTCFSFEGNGELLNRAKQGSNVIDQTCRKKLEVARMGTRPVKRPF